MRYPFFNSKSNSFFSQSKLMNNIWKTGSNIDHREYNIKFNSLLLHMYIHVCIYIYKHLYMFICTVTVFFQIERIYRSETKLNFWKSQWLKMQKSDFLEVCVSEFFCFFRFFWKITKDDLNRLRCLFYTWSPTLLKIFILTWRKVDIKLFSR